MSCVKNLLCRAGDFELNVPFMEWPDGRVLALFGPSGSGKSTLAWALCGLKPVEKGFQWIFKDRDLAQLSPPERKISFLFQSLELFPNMTVKQNILFPAQARKVPGEETAERFQKLVTALEISHILKKTVHFLSGGEKQRIALARALIIKPNFLILDEPFSSFDNRLKEKAIALIKGILKEEKTSTLLISHSQEEVKALAHSTLYINKGRLTSNSR